MFNPIIDGISFKPTAADNSRLSNPVSMVAIAPYLLGSPIPQDNIVLVGCDGHLPATCIAITFGSGLDANITKVISRWQRHGIDNLIAIGYCDRAELAEIITRSGGLKVTDAFSTGSSRSIALLRVDEDQSVWQVHNATLEETEVSLDMDLAIEAMHAGYHAWMPFGVIDTLVPLGDRKKRFAAEIDEAAQREQYREPERGWDLVDRIMDGADLPTAAEAASVGTALLDCRVLEHAMSKIICADDSQIDAWFWIARTLGVGAHYAMGIAGFAAWREHIGARARQAWAIQKAHTPDPRTRLLYRAVGNRDPLGDVFAIVEERMYQCERPCCAAH